MNGKGSKRRIENFALIQKNWSEINWKSNDCKRTKKEIPKKPK